MSDKTKKGLELLAVTLAVLTGMAGMFGAFILLPYRMQAAEYSIKQLMGNRIADKELLTRIEERLISVQKQLEKREK